MLRYRLEGKGAPLLLIHGWGVTYSIWQNLAPLLRIHYQLIMIELPGIGGSPEVALEQPYYQASAEAIEELRQSLGIEAWSILAYSSGTRVAEAYVQRYPHNVARMIFLCPVYLNEWYALWLRILETAHPSSSLANWIFSDWRLYGLILALCFNGRHYNYTRKWRNEIELQSMETLVRTLCELPDKGRAPFELPAVPTLFIWGKRDTLIHCPRRPRPNDIVLPTNHGAPILAAPKIAEAVIPFLTEGTFVSSHTHLKPERYWRGGEVSHREELVQEFSFVCNPVRRRFALRKRKVLREVE